GPGHMGRLDSYCLAAGPQSCTLPFTRSISTKMLWPLLCFGTTKLYVWPTPVTHSSQRISAGFSCVLVPFESMVTTLNPITSTSWLVSQKTVPEPLPRVLVNEMATFSQRCSQTAGFWSRFGIVGQLSQASPTVSKS